MNKIKKESGQAVLETFVVLIVLIPAIFAVIQLSIIAFGAIAAYDAAQSANRSAIIQSNDNFAKQNAALSGIYVMSTQISGANNIIPGTVDTCTVIPAGKQMTDHEGNSIYAYDVTQNYLQKIMFSSLVNPLPGSQYFSGGINVMSCSANSRMVRSPDPTYRTKAYSNSN